MRKQNTQEQDDRFYHEKMDAYGVALEFVELVQGLIKSLPKGKGQLGDQLERASESIVLRIAEGSGGIYRSADQKRHFRAAKASAAECAAVLDLCRIRKMWPKTKCLEGRSLLIRVAQMTNRLSR